MALFDYAGQLQSGAMFQGTLEADSQEHAAEMLADMEVRVTSLRPTERTAYVAQLSLDELQFFNEQLAAMAKSSVPLQEGLRHLAADVGSRKLKRLLLDLSADLATGTPLEQAIEKQQRRFPTKYADVVKAGLRTGDLGGTLYGLATHLRLKSHFRRVMLELAVYPLAVLLASLLILAFFMRFVMPELVAIAHDLEHDWGVQMPAVLEFTCAVVRGWPTIELVMLLIPVAAVVLFLSLWASGGTVRERFLRSIPGFAHVYWSSALARFTHTSALAAYSATPLSELISASGAASGSPALGGASRRVAERLTQGQSLEDAAAPEPDVPPLWTCVVATTAARGEMPAALEELARAYESRAEQRVGALRIIMGPLLLLSVGVVVGCIVAMVFGVVGTLLQMLSAF